MKRLSRSLALVFCIFGCARPSGSETPTPDGDDLARVVLNGAGQQRCGLPSIAEVEKAIVTVRVMVLPNGQPQLVEVTGTSQPDQGLEAAARECAMKYRYRSARDASGTPRREWTHEFNVEFAKIGRSF